MERRAVDRIVEQEPDARDAVVEHRLTTGIFGPLNGALLGRDLPLLVERIENTPDHVAGNTVVDNPRHPELRPFLPFRWIARRKSTCHLQATATSLARSARCLIPCSTPVSM